MGSSDRLVYGRGLGCVAIGGAPSVISLLAASFLFVGSSWALIAVTAPLVVARLVSGRRQETALAVYTAAVSGETGIGSLLTWRGHVPGQSGPSERRT